MTVLTNTVKDRKKKVTYIREVQNELKKVTWTSKDELKTCTKIVIGSTFVFGIGIYVVDLIIRGALNTISGFVHLIGG